VSSDDFIRGLVAIIEHDLDSAVKYLHSASTKDTSNIIAFTLLGDILRQKGDAETAKKLHISLLPRAFITPGQKARVYKSLALDAVALNDYKKGLEYIEQAISLKPDQWCYELCAEILEKLERWEDAFSVLAKTDGNKQILAMYKVKIGDNIVQDDPHKARIIYKEALKLDANCLPAMVKIGDAYMQEGKIAQALEWWEKALTEFPERADTIIDKIESAYYETGEFDDARKLYRKILKENPDAEIVRIRLASIYEKMGELQTAQNIIRQAPNKTLLIALDDAKISCMLGDNHSAIEIIENELEKLVKEKMKYSESLKEE